VSSRSNAERVRPTIVSLVVEGSAQAVRLTRRTRRWTTSAFWTPFLIFARGCRWPTSTADERQPLGELRAAETISDQDPERAPPASLARRPVTSDDARGSFP
jgi:hypothetical protein